MESEELADKGTSHDWGKETDTGCMEGKPPVQHKMKKPCQAKSNHVVRFDLKISETGGKKGIKTPQKTTRGQRERITKKKVQLSRAEGRAQLVENSVVLDQSSVCAFMI